MSRKIRLFIISDTVTQIQRNNAGDIEAIPWNEYAPTPVKFQCTRFWPIK